MRLIFLFLLISGTLFSQAENALPPGPSNISGRLIDPSGKGIPNAAITVRYADGKQRACDTFRSYEDGYFTAYILRDNQDYVELEIIVNGLLCKIIRYDNPGIGRNLGHPLDPIQCPVKK